MPSGLLIILLLVIASRVHAQEPLPSVDPLVQRLQAPDQHVQAEAFFGFSMASGRLRVSENDTLDDVVICALGESYGGHTEVGAAYVFENEQLAQPTDKPSRLTPTGDFNCHTNLGNRAMTIGNPRGNNGEEPYDNLILIGSALRDAEYPSAQPAEVTSGGAVEIYDFMASSSLMTVQRSLFAPKNLVWSTTHGNHLLEQVPTEVHTFGHGLCLGDVTRDDVVDLIVGAPGTNPPGESANQGRFYIFEGHGDFFDDPYLKWLGLDAVEPDNSALDFGSQFGVQVAACNLTADSAAEIIVGRQDRVTPHATLDTSCPQGGSAYVFRGAYLHDLFQGDPYDPTPGTGNPDGTLNRVNQPPRPDLSSAAGGLDEETPEYQMLFNPFGIYQAESGTPRIWADNFGYFVFNVEDVGSPLDSPDASDFDDVHDIAVFAESTDYIGSEGDPNEPEVLGGGGVFVYFGTGETGEFMVNPDHVLLQRPDNVELPASAARFGRAVARIDSWWNSQTQQLEPGLLISELEAEWDEVDQAGRVYLLRLPLPAPPDPYNGYDPIDADNAWVNQAMDPEPLTEPDPSQDEVGPAHFFGSWIVALKYSPDFVGQQFIVSSRQAAVKVDTTTYEGAGRAFPFVGPAEESGP